MGYPIHLSRSAAKPQKERNGEDGFPHSEIAGSKPAHGSPTLIAACHVLHRLYMPRHPPNALTSRLRVHTTNDNAGSAKRQTRTTAGLVDELSQPDNHLIDLVMHRSITVGHKPSTLNPCATASIKKPIHNVKVRRSNLRLPRPGSNPGGIRCLHLWSNRNLVEPIGIEPMTPCLQSRCSPS